VLIKPVTGGYTNTLALIKKNLPLFINLINVNTSRLSRKQNCKEELIHIARIVLFLASDDSKGMSGQIIGSNDAMM